MTPTACRSLTDAIRRASTIGRFLREDQPEVVIRGAVAHFHCRLRLLVGPERRDRGRPENEGGHRIAFRWAEDGRHAAAIQLTLNPQHARVEIEIGFPRVATLAKRVIRVFDTEWCGAARDRAYVRASLTRSEPCSLRR